MDQLTQFPWNAANQLVAGEVQRFEVFQRAKRFWNFTPQLVAPEVQRPQLWKRRPEARRTAAAAAAATTAAAAAAVRQLAVQLVSAELQHLQALAAPAGGQRRKHRRRSANRADAGERNHFDQGAQCVADGGGEQRLAEIQPFGKFAGAHPPLDQPDAGRGQRVQQRRQPPALCERGAAKVDVPERAPFDALERLWVGVAKVLGAQRRASLALVDLVRRRLHVEHAAGRRLHLKHHPARHVPHAGVCVPVPAGRLLPQVHVVLEPQRLQRRVGLDRLGHRRLLRRGRAPQRAAVHVEQLGNVAVVVAEQLPGGRARALDRRHVQLDGLAGRLSCIHPGNHGVHLRFHRRGCGVHRCVGAVHLRRNAGGARAALCPPRALPLGHHLDRRRPPAELAALGVGGDGKALRVR